MADDFVYISNREGYYIPHDAFRALNTQGVVYLGIDNNVAEILIDSKNPLFRPRDTTAAAFSFWNIIAWGFLLMCVYFSFTEAWYYFLIGLGVFSVFHKANKKGNASNYVDNGVYDRAFYDNVMAIDGWLYKVKRPALAQITQLYKGPR
ncbi:hypothetical protein [Cloacibacillus porcorum]